MPLKKLKRKEKFRYPLKNLVNRAKYINRQIDRQIERERERERERKERKGEDGGRKGGIPEIITQEKDMKLLPNTLSHKSEQVIEVLHI